MAFFLTPIAGVALRYAAVATAGYVLARSLPRAEPDERVETAMDDLDDGLSVSSADGAARLAGRLRRSFRLGTSGVRIDASMLGRIKVKRL